MSVIITRVLSTHITNMKNICVTKEKGCDCKCLMLITYFCVYALKKIDVTPTCFPDPSVKCCIMVCFSPSSSVSVSFWGWIWGQGSHTIRKGDIKARRQDAVGSQFITNILVNFAYLTHCEGNHVLSIKTNKRSLGKHLLVFNEGLSIK